MAGRKDAVMRGMSVIPVFSNDPGFSIAGAIP
jgi:hypothetical protein